MASLKGLRLLVVTQYFWPEDFRINELVIQLVQRGHDVTVLTGKPNYPTGEVFPDYRERPDGFNTYGGARIVRVPMLPRGSGSLRLVLNYLSFAVSATVVGLRRLRGQIFDAVFVFEPSPITVGLPAVALRRRFGAPLVFWVLDQWPETLAAVGAIRSPVALKIVGRLVRFIYSRCDVVLGQSRAMVDAIRQYCPPDHAVEYFPNWVEGDYLNRADGPAPEVPTSSARFTVMFAGNIGESQSFPAILEAADRLRHNDDIRWVIVGDGRAADFVRAEVERRNLGDRFILAGRFPTARMPSFYRHADALLVALRREPIFAMTIPGKIQSYLAFGLPVLGMLDGEGARVIDEAGAGFTCAADDAVGLAAIVERMASTAESERQQMGARGSAYAAREFDRDTLVDRLERILERVAAEPLTTARSK